MARTLRTLVLFAGIAWGLGSGSSYAADWTLSLATPAQIGAPGSTVTYNGTITNSSGSSLAIDANIGFTASPATQGFTVSFSSAFLALNLAVPTSGYTGPIFDVTWDSDVPSGTTGAGTLEMNAVAGANPGVVSAAFQLKTPGVGTFCSEGVGPTATETSLAVEDSNGVVARVAWHDPVSGVLGYSSRIGTTWTGSTIATGVTGTAAPVLILDANHAPHVLYHSAGTLVHASAPAGTWTFETVDTGGDMGGAPAVAFDAFGDLHVSYQDVTHGDLKYAHRSGALWSTQVVDTTGVVGANSSIAVDESGVPSISYYDTSHQHLALATSNGPGWNLQTVDAGSAVGSASSIVVGNGTTSIAYRDAGLHRLRLAENSGSGWTYQTADASGDPGAGCRLALNSLGEPRIGYADAATQSVRYALRWQGNWESGPVATGATAVVGFSPASTDEPLLSYVKSSGSALELATIGDCSVTAVGGPADVLPRFVLHANRPNPFTHGTILAFTVRDRSSIRVRVFDAAGRLVAQPFESVVTPGRHEVAWDGLGSAHQRLAPGLYLYEVKRNTDVLRGRMVMLR